MVERGKTTILSNSMKFSNSCFLAKSHVPRFMEISNYMKCLLKMVFLVSSQEFHFEVPLHNKPQVSYVSMARLTKLEQS